MLKRIVVINIIILIVLNSRAFAQTYTLSIIDAKSKLPIENVQVDSSHETEYSTNEGLVKFSKKPSIIVCSHINYSDTLIHFSDIKGKTISLTKNTLKLSEVQVKGKYNKAKHVLRLLKRIKQRAKKCDTTLYYKVHLENNIENSEYSAVYEFIIERDFKGYKSLPIKDIRKNETYQDFEVTMIDSLKYRNTIPDSLLHVFRLNFPYHGNINAELNRLHSIKRRIKDTPSNSQLSKIRGKNKTFTFESQFPGYEAKMILNFKMDALISLNICKNCKNMTNYGNRDTVLATNYTKSSAYSYDSIQCFPNYINVSEKYTIIDDSTEYRLSTKLEMQLLDSVPNKLFNIIFKIKHNTIETYEYYKYCIENYHIDDIKLAEPPKYILDIYDNYDN